MVTRYTLRTCRFVTAVDLNRWPTQAKLPILLHMCAPISELPSHVCRMVENKISSFPILFCKTDDLVPPPPGPLTSSHFSHAKPETRPFSRVADPDLYFLGGCRFGFVNLFQFLFLVIFCSLRLN